MTLRAWPFALLLPVAVFAQVPTQPEVTKNLVCDRGSSCGFGYISGRKYETLASGKIGIVVVLDTVDKYNRTDIFILNESDGSVDVLPSNFVFTEVSPEQKGLKYVDSDKLVKSAERDLAWGNTMTAMSGSMARQQTTTTTNSTGTVTANSIGEPPVTGTYSGTSTSTTSTPDRAAQERAAQTIQTRNEAFANFASFTSRTTLRANSVPAGQSVRGYLLWERDKKAKSIMLSCIVGDTIYQFPFDLTVP